MHLDFIPWLLLGAQGFLTSLGLGILRPPAVAPASTTSPSSPPSYSMKLVNENVSDADLAQLQSLGITLVSGEWGMADASPGVVLALLDRLAAHQLKLVVNFSDGSAWGYREDGTDPADQPPRWQTRQVTDYVRRIKHHPAIFAYDISNEAGENLPNGSRFRHTIPQLQQAARDIRTIDSSRPIMIRMHYWDEEDGDFTAQNPFAAGLADIVMLNLYSNYTANGQTPTTPSMVSRSGQTLINKIRTVDPGVRIWVALAAFREAPQFLTPSTDDLRRDITAAHALRGVENIGFFGWGPERYPSAGRGWYLPQAGPALLETIRSFTAPPQQSPS